MYPYTREWSVDSININRYKAIKDNWEYSRKCINDIRECLKQSESKISSEVITIAAAGSLGRMEANREVSDADLIILLSDNIELDSQEATEIYNSIWEILNPLKLERPKATGVFAKPINQKQLLSSIGKADEEYATYGKRLLLILETQPLYRDASYTQVINAIIERYADKYVKQDSKKEWTLLLNDLIRYFRSLAVNYQWDFNNDVEKWAIRNIKLRHSRLVMYSGLLMLIGEASKVRVDKVNWLQEKLKMTPLERIAWVYERNEDWSFHRVIGHYNTFILNMNDPKVREALNYNPSELSSENSGGDFYEDRYTKNEFASLKANSDGLIAELLRFVFARRGDWSERFFEYLIF
ncbi:hypothetical protein QQ054_02175 [Oscillatoria amoena NRMC-F 0135]|nr:hypothetical protein [Geitlerinema splendidum]MDL5044850.1 hypothetical protein [Oscillatoria amoena NRMC-F 0135]